MNLEKKGILVVVSGFSGSGKGTIMKELLKKYPEQYALSISATTRQPREGETDGVEYFFKETKEFEQMIADGELLEYAQYVDNYYGTPKAYVEKQLADGKDVILEIEIQGALKVKKQFPQTLLLLYTAIRRNLKRTADRQGHRGYGDHQQAFKPCMRRSRGH